MEGPEHLSRQRFLQRVTIDHVTTDRYGRAVAKVIVDGMSVNKALIKEGQCWVYRKYVRDSEFYDLENEAQANKRGLSGAVRTQCVLIMFSIACRKGNRVSNPVQEKALTR